MVCQSCECVLKGKESCTVYRADIDTETTPPTIVSFTSTNFDGKIICQILPTTEESNHGNTNESSCMAEQSQYAS
jgi:hypothetical protein